MRLIALCAVLVLLSACRGTQPYSQQDLQQIRTAYVPLRPLYVDFKRAFFAGNGPQIMVDFRKEQQDCKVLDQVDARDTIDPNVGLFYASSSLDDWCNAIETATATWEHKHHLKYDHTILLAKPKEIFLGTDTEYPKMKRWLKYPGRLA